MYKKVFFLLLVLSSLLCNAQESPKKNLSEDTVKLKELTVTVNIPLNNKDVVDFYRTNQFSTLDNINARLDGMSLIKRGAYALEPQMNGFSGGQLNVTIDGMKMFGACTDKMDPITSYIEPSNLKAIKLKSGTNCSENGCNIGGSVDMTLQEPNVAVAHQWLLDTKVFRKAGMYFSRWVRESESGHGWPMVFIGKQRTIQPEMDRLFRSVSLRKRIYTQH